MIEISDDFFKPITSYIYVLVDPRTNEEFYVGITCYPKNRLTEHMNRCWQNVKQHASGRYIRSMMEAGRKPIMVIIDEVVTNLDWRDGYKAPEREKYWIDELRRQGKPLVNETRRKTNRV